jgi:hypothetical protein
MKLLKYFFSVAFLLAVAFSCKKELNEDIAFLATDSAPGKLSALFDITQDNTGLVTITPNGESIAFYEIYYGDAATTPAKVIPGKNTQHVYAEGVYNVKIVGHSVTGKIAETTKPLTVAFRAPENLDFTLTTDPANNFKVSVKASALYETFFKVYFGDVPNEVGVSFLEGDVVNHTYAAVGTYSVKVVAYSGGVATTQLIKTVTIVDPILLPLTFESSTINYAFTNFDGGVVTVINNPQSNGINTSGKVAKMVKNAGQTWGGSFINLTGNIDFSANKIFRMKVFSPRVGAKVLLKVENAANTALSYEKETLTTVANAWEDMVFNYTAVNTANTYQHIVIIFDNGTMGDGSANFTFLFDDIRLTNTLPAAQINLPVTFDDPTVNYTVTDFGGNATIDALDPGNAANKVKKTTKTNGSQTWAGTTIGTSTGFASPVPFTSTSTQMSVKVYSPAAGIPVRLKVEDHLNNTHTVETEKLTTVANAWETITFDFSTPAPTTPALNFTYTYDMASIFFDFGTAGNGKVFYWDDVKFLPPVLGLPIDFESSTIAYTFTNFDGGVATVINNPNSGGINTSAKVGKMVKNAGQTWGGSFLTLANPINFSVTKTFKMKVFSPRVGAKVLLKVENLTNGGISYEKEVLTTTANAWELLTFDYSAINTVNSYQKIVLIFDNGTMGDGSANFTFYFDDITLN